VSSRTDLGAHAIDLLLCLLIKDGRTAAKKLGRDGCADTGWDNRKEDIFCINPMTAIILWIIGMTVSSATHIKRRVGMLVRITLLLDDRLTIAISDNAPPVARITCVAFVIERCGRAS
jgi:hypothetical protein